MVLAVSLMFAGLSILIIVPVSLLYVGTSYTRLWFFQICGCYWHSGSGLLETISPLTMELGVSLVKADLLTSEGVMVVGVGLDAAVWVMLQ